MHRAICTVFHKIGTPLYFFNNILPCGPISIIDIPNCSAENRLAICDTFTYLTFMYSSKIVTSHPHQYLRVADNKKLITMPFSADDKHAIKLLWQTKHLMSMFPDKQWSLGGLKKLIHTRSSAIAEELRDASCQLKSCQLPCNSVETTYTTSPDQIDGMKLEI